MNKINKLVVLFLSLLAFMACDEKEEHLLINENDIKSEITLSAENVVLEKGVEVPDALTVNMSKPTFNVDVVAEYKIILSVGEMSKKIAVSGDALSKVFSSLELNKLVLDLGAEPEKETAVTVKGMVKLGATEVFTAEKTVMVTPYAMKLDLTTTWGIVGSATPNGWSGPDLPFYKSTENPEEMVAYVTLMDGEIKFRENNEWGGDYGGSGSLSGDLTTGPDNNIAVTAGKYKITVNLTALTYKIEPFTWGIVGTPNNWGQDGPDIPLEYDPTSDMWKTVVKLAAGEIKFRKNNTWGEDYGGSGSLNGNLTTTPNNNIAVEAGNYLVEVSFKDMTYKLTKIDFIWGIVGTVNEWGNTGIPDIKMSMDYGNEGVWYVNGVTFADGEFKFRANEDWGNNYGLDDSGEFKFNSSKNIPVTAGTYDVVLDLSNVDAPTYKLNKK